MPHLAIAESDVDAERLLALDAALTMPHHRAVGGDGATVLERALREHNLSAAARVSGVEIPQIFTSVAIRRP